MSANGVPVVRKCHIYVLYVRSGCQDDCWCDCTVIQDSEPEVAKTLSFLSVSAPREETHPDCRSRSGCDPYCGVV